MWKSLNLSHSQVWPKASFSTWACLCSVGVSERDAYATGFHCSSSFCRRTAPRPYDDALADGFSSLFGLYKASTGGDESSRLGAQKAPCCALPQHQWFLFERRSLNGLSFSARHSMNLHNWFTILRKLRTSLIYFHLQHCSCLVRIWPHSAF